MNCQYLFSSPDGDILLEPEDLARPFLITPTETHPFLTLKDYFEAIKTFILEDPAKPLLLVFKGQLKKETTLDDIREIMIRSEKHGALYHPASVEIVFQKEQLKVAVSTAVSKKGKEWLTHEYEILKNLNRSYNFPYLPRVYHKGEVDVHAGDEKRETLTMLLAEWFEDYHEWHYSIDIKDNTQKICIWDFKNGNRYASKEETSEIFRQASRILTLYYDLNQFNQIYPWHHAAGDFIVRTHNGKTDVKLSTARRYESIMDSFSKDTVNPLIAIVYFFLNLTLRMRLDKLDGVGETAWAEDISVHAATTGFFEAMKIMQMQDRYNLGPVKELLSLMQSFDEKELEGLFQSLLGLYQQDDPADLSMIKTNLKDHATLLHQTLRNFHLETRKK